MEKALILGKIGHRVPSKVVKKFKEIKGVTDANFIFGPYDFYVIVETETKTMVGDITLQLRSINGVSDTITCYIVSFSDIRPDSTGPLAE
jgi:uncharacterized protein with GYD domain